MKGRVDFQLGPSYFYIMTITIPDHVQHPAPVDGFDQYVFLGVPGQQSVSATNVIEPTTLSVSGTVVYSDGTSQAGLLLVPELRPFHNAALHVVSQPFVAAITGLLKNRIRRFM